MSEPCPCRYVTPCSKDCTCVNSFSSAGCKRCCRYGSLKERTDYATYLSAVIDAANEKARR